MSKVIRRSSYRVVVTPPQNKWLWSGKFSSEELREKDERRSADECAAEVRRHIDNEGVSVEHDAEPICCHCGSAWTEDRSDYNGGCCDKDEGAEDARLAAAAATQN